MPFFEAIQKQKVFLNIGDQLTYTIHDFPDLSCKARKPQSVQSVEKTHPRIVHSPEIVFAFLQHFKNVHSQLKNINLVKRGRKNRINNAWNSRGVAQVPPSVTYDELEERKSITWHCLLTTNFGFFLDYKKFSFSANSVIERHTLYLNNVMQNNF